MATQKKKDTPSKEKMETSPTSTKPKKSLTTINSTSSQKQVPNYLKPTASSSGPPKKLVTSSTKPNINRRRSFDKPPSSSSSSLNHNKSPLTSLRSPSPVLSKVNSLPKPHTKKIIQSSSSARANTTMKKTNVVITLGKNEEETHGKESEQVLTEVDNSKKEDEASSLCEIKEDVIAIEINNKELVDFEAQIGEKPIICEDVKPSNLDDQKECVADVKIEEVGETTNAVEIVNENHEEKKEEENNIEKEAIKEEGDEMVKEEDTTENAKEYNLSGGKDDMKKNGENTEMASDEGEIKSRISDEGNDKNNEVGNTSAKEVPQQVHYNDVIEETKNKLLEKRKNKVKALVGAFETVISLQEPDA